MELSSIGGYNASRAEALSGSGATASPETRQRVQELRKRDLEVRSHEQAHLAAAGSAASGGATFSFARGPDGKSYAESGEVKIQIRSGRTPDETARNAAQAEKAALAPRDPSPQDMQVAASARQIQTQARAEAREQRSPAASGSAGQKERAYQSGKPSTRGSLVDLVA